MKAGPLNERLLVVILAGVQFTHILDFMVLMPLGPQLIRVMHIDARQFGLLVAAYVFVGALASFLAALHLDRFDRKQALTFVFCGFLTSTLLCGFADSFETLLAARALAGAFGGVAGSIVHSIIGDAFADQRRGAATGAVMSAFSFSAVLGVPIGLFFANHFDWRAPFFFVAAIAVLILAGIRWVVPSMRGHIDAGTRKPGALRQVRAVFAEPNHRRAFVLMATLIFGGFSADGAWNPVAIEVIRKSLKDLGILDTVPDARTLYNDQFVPVKL